MFYLLAMFYGKVFETPVINTLGILLAGYLWSSTVDRFMKYFKLKLKKAVK